VGVHFYATGKDNVSCIETVTFYAAISVNDMGGVVPRFSLVRPEQGRIDLQSKVDGERLGGTYRSSEGRTWFLPASVILLKF
jgi:hypothetical protein